MAQFYMTPWFERIVGGDFVRLDSHEYGWRVHCGMTTKRLLKLLGIQDSESVLSFRVLIWPDENGQWEVFVHHYEPTAFYFVVEREAEMYLVNRLGLFLPAGRYSAAAACNKGVCNDCNDPDDHLFHNESDLRCI